MNGGSYEKMDKYDELLREISERLARIEAKQDSANETHELAKQANETAHRAESKADENARAIDGIKKVAMWAVGIAVAFGGGVLTILFK